MLKYIDEHLNCINYPSTENAPFNIIENESEGPVCHNISEPFLMMYFIDSGKVDLADPMLQSLFSIEESSFFILHRHTAAVLTAAPGSRILSLKLKYTDNNMKLCPKFLLKSVAEECCNDVEASDYGKQPVQIFSMNERIRSFVSFTYDCIKDGLNCFHFHINKQEELLFLLRGYYSRKDLYRMFSTIMDNPMSFREKIEHRPQNVSSVRAMSEYMNLSVSAFIRKFKKEFGMTPYKWIEDRTCESILRDIRFTDKTFEEISSDYGMSSGAYLTAYCRKHFGKTPSGLRYDNGAEPSVAGIAGPKR